MRTMELVTEARVLKFDLPSTAIEAGIRTFAASALVGDSCVVGQDCEQRYAWRFGQRRPVHV